MQSQQGMNVKGNRQYVTQEELDRIKQFPVKTALFSRGRFTGFYDESTENFYIMDQYGRLTGAVAKVPKEKFETTAPGPREDTVGEYKRQKAAAVAEQPSDSKASPNTENAFAEQEEDRASNLDVPDVDSDNTAKRSATVFQKKKGRPGLIIGVCVGGAVLAAVGVCLAQYFGVMDLPFLNPVVDAIRSVLG